MTEHSTQLLGEAEVVALATDGSLYTDGAVKEAIFLAQGCGAKIVALHVISVDSESVTGLSPSRKTVDPELNEHLDRIRKMADDSGIACEIIVEESCYSPEKTLVDLAYKHKADVLIMGRHGRKGLLKLLVGSMTSKVIGQGFPQVLVVPHESSVKGERILVATDGSESGAAAIETAVSMGKNCKALQEIYVLSVAASESGLAEAEALTAAVCKQAQEQAPRVPFHPLALAGKSSAEVITRTAAEKEVDMILIGGHGKGLSKLLMGHVTEKVIGRTDCAVLVLEKSKDEEAGAVPESGD